MKNTFITKQRLLLLFVCLLISPIYIFGQDLGSSSELFRKKSTKKKSSPKSKKKKSTVRRKSSKKKTSKKTTSKKTRRKKKTTARVSKRRSTRSTKRKPKRKTRTRATNAKKTRSVRNSANAASNKRKPKNDIIINVGDSSSSNFEELFETAIEEGNTARNLRNYVKAEDSYSRAKSIDPNDSRAIYGLGNIYSDQQRWEEAEQAYRSAIKLEPESPSAHIAISFVLTQPVVGSNLGGRYEEAEKMAQRAIALDSQNAIGHNQLGVARELRGFIGEETEGNYLKAIELAPEFALAYAHLGRLLRKKGEIKRSSQAYRKAIKFSVDVPTMILVADVMQSQQRFLESEQLLRNALRQDNKNPTALYLLGRALTTRKKYAEAESVLKKSVEVSPNSFVSYTLLGSMYYRSGDLINAERVLTQALDVISKNEEKRLAQEFEELGDRFMKAKKISDALRLYQRAKFLDSEKKSLNSKILLARSNS